MPPLHCSVHTGCGFLVHCSCFCVGQGVVQFAKMLKVEPSIISAPEPQVALKFYVQPELIRVETAVYGSPTLATYGVLPRSAQLHLNTWKELQTTTGASLPPCLVMERGMSLKEWMIHSRMSTNTLASDCKTAIKVCSLLWHVCLHRRELLFLDRSTKLVQCCAYSATEAI